MSLLLLFGTSTGSVGQASGSSAAAAVGHSRSRAVGSAAGTCQVEAVSSNTFRNELLRLIFQGASVPLLADDAASSPLTSLYVSLHTADPGEVGDQSTNEISYGNYARVSVVRSAAGWRVSYHTVSPMADVGFPAGVSGSATATYVGIGTDASGAGKLLYSGTLSPNIVCGSGITPTLTTATVFDHSQ